MTKYRELVNSQPKSEWQRDRVGTYTVCSVCGCAAELEMPATGDFGYLVAYCGCGNVEIVESDENIIELSQLRSVKCECGFILEREWAYCPMCGKGK